MSLLPRGLYQTAAALASPFRMVFVRFSLGVRKVGFILPVMKSCILAALVLALGVSAFVVSAQPQPRGGLTIEQLIDIQHPSNAMWAPDGRHVVFVSDRAGVSKVYVVELTAADQAATPREVPATTPMRT